MRSGISSRNAVHDQLQHSHRQRVARSERKPETPASQINLPSRSPICFRASVFRSLSLPSFRAPVSGGRGVIVAVPRSGGGPAVQFKLRGSCGLGLLIDAKTDMTGGRVSLKWTLCHSQTDRVRSPGESDHDCRLVFGMTSNENSHVRNRHGTAHLCRAMLLDCRPGASGHGSPSCRGRSSASKPLIPCNFAPIHERSSTKQVLG